MSTAFWKDSSINQRHPEEAPREDIDQHHEKYPSVLFYFIL